MKPHEYEVEGMNGMTRKQVRITNVVANTLIGVHGMCIDCAIKCAVAFVWCQDQSRPPMRTELCTSVCKDALREFFTNTLGCTPKEVRSDELPTRAH
jgi:hypothetical protein